MSKTGGTRLTRFVGLKASVRNWILVFSPIAKLLSSDASRLLCLGHRCCSPIVAELTGIRNRIEPLQCRRGTPIEISCEVPNEVRRCKELAGTSHWFPNLSIAPKDWKWAYVHDLSSRRRTQSTWPCSRLVGQVDCPSEMHAMAFLNSAASFRKIV
jgi:hypothetical protein